ncbi:MAG: hypothetical protein IMF11_00715 [Proteobacteria bacterium]|nr:hypothetical protein [Pseudomonadota bacterium]
MNEKSDGTDSICLTLFCVDRIAGWRGAFARAAATNGLMSHERGASLCVWNPRDVGSCGQELSYVDGWIIVRQWLGPKQNGISINPHRFYFESSPEVPSAKPEREIVAEAAPKRPSVAERIKSCFNLASVLADHIDGFDAKPNRMAHCEREVHKHTALLLGGGSVAPAGESLGTLLMKHGFFEVPEGLGVVIAAQDIKHQAVIGYRQEVEAALRRCGIQGDVLIVSLLKVAERLDALDRGSKKKKSAKALLIGIPGRRGEALPSAIEGVLNRLDDRQLSYRLFSIDNKSLEWSAFDQLGSLLQATGGVPYSLQLPWPAEVRSPVCLGVDIGHPLSSRESWLALSLVDSRGVHLGSWRCLQPRDETARIETLAKGLTWVKDAISGHGRQNSDVLVFRDGRLHFGEKVATYAEALGGRVSFVEIAKNHNPVMFIIGDDPKPVGPGTVCFPESSVTSFIVPISPTSEKHLPRTLKIHMRAEWDSLGLGIKRVASLTAGLSFSPSLGLRPHGLPAPIYWANGIASIGPRNRQFGGQKYIEELID